MFDFNKIEDLQFSTEKQTLERKSARIKATDLAIPITAMANADGGYLVIGIEDDGKITGIDEYQKNINELIRVPFDYCKPTVKAEVNTVRVIDNKKRDNHILLMRIFPSDQVISNQADEVFLRVGDKSKKLNFEQRLQLTYAKGVRYFEDQNVSGATISDIDLEAVNAYCHKIGYTKGNAEFFLRHNNEFISTFDESDKVSAAAILLFGKNPQKFFPRARVRFIRYEGTSAEVGERMNVIKDVKFTGRILDQVNDVIAFVKTQIREYTKLGSSGVFQTTPEYPEFCWMELIVNAVAHRDYSIMGTDIQVKMFDDHFLVESPGTLPGLVRINNIREYHFSRNPKIVELLNAYDLVKEFGEGIDRIYRDMADACLPEPSFRQSEFMFYATLKNKLCENENSNWIVPTSNEKGPENIQNYEKGPEKGPENIQNYEKGPEKGPENIQNYEKGPEKGPENKTIDVSLREEAVLSAIRNNDSVSRSTLAKELNISEKQVRTALTHLKEAGRIHYVGVGKGGHWVIVT